MKLFKKGFTALALLALPLLSFAEVHKGYTSTSSGSIKMMVDSIDYRSDLTRVYGTLVGRPHTSNRIDGIVAVQGEKTFDATDLDGVDMKRWFQWEDDGLIPVEIDFPVIKAECSFSVELDGPRGESQWSISAIPAIRTAPKNKKR